MCLLDGTFQPWRSAGALALVNFVLSVELLQKAISDQYDFELGHHLSRRRSR